MDPLVPRVAARSKTAGFIPSRWWVTKKAELKKLLVEPLNDGKAGHIAWKIQDRLISFFHTFEKELLAFGMHQFAEKSVTDRVSTIINQLTKLAAGYEEFAKHTDAVRYPPEGVLDIAIWTVQIRVEVLLEEKVKTLKDALKGVWKTDARIIAGFTERLLKKATPEEKAAIEQSQKEDYGPSSSIKWQFFHRMKIDTAVKRLVTIDKKEWKVEPIDWMEWLEKVLTAAYAEGGQGLDAFTEFDFHGVKVVVDDKSLGQLDISAYVRYLDKAYALLKNKHLDRVWYGTFFIKCEDCGGYNQNTGKWKDVGGNYPIGPDVVNIFSRPSSFIVELLAHELGHRYWFKFMNQSQRGKFESLVKVHKSTRPIDQQPRTIPQEKIKRAKDKVDEAAKALRSWLIPLKTSRKWFRDTIKENYEIISKAGWTFSNDLLDAVHAAGADATITPEVKQLFDEALAAGGVVQKATFNFDEAISNKIHDEPEPAQAPENRDKYWMALFRKYRDEWLQDFELKIEAAVASAYIYIDAAVLEFNKKEEGRSSEAWKKYNEEYETDTRPVTPVSDYGKSNIDEAFAEVFAHYVLETDMSRDQLESFRSVLSSKSPFNFPITVL